MPCPYLRYRSRDENHEFDHDRPYCTVTESFVSPMRADICNDRHEFTHETHCAIYQRVTEQREETASTATGSLD